MYRVIQKLQEKFKKKNYKFLKIITQTIFNKKLLTSNKN